MRIIVVACFIMTGLTACLDSSGDGAADTGQAPTDTNNGSDVGSSDTTAPTDAGGTPDVVATDVVATDTGPADTGSADSGGPPDTVADTTPPVGAMHTTGMSGWTMASGEETTKCVVKRLGNVDPIKVRAIHTTLSKGSHHLIVYRSTDTQERTTPFNCTPFVGSLSGNAGPLMISQVREETLALPPGVAFELAANQMIRLEAHYLNYFPDPISPEAEVRFEEIPDGAFEHLADFLFYGDPGVWLPPGPQMTNFKYIDVPTGAKVYAITGHTHQLGTNVEIYKSAGSSDPGTSIYPGEEPFKWDEAPIEAFDPPLEFAAGEGFRFRCSWNNTTNQTVTFGESANAEMCFFWAYYYPSQGYRLCAPPLFPCSTDN